MPAVTPVARILPNESNRGFTPGTVLAGRYRVIGLLGRGGMGEVYRADDIKLGTPVALKFLPRSVADDPLRRERFLSEVRTTRPRSPAGPRWAKPHSKSDDRSHSMASDMAVPYAPQKPGKGRLMRTVYSGSPRLNGRALSPLFVRAVVKVSVRACRFRSDTTLPWFSSV